MAKGNSFTYEQAATAKYLVHTMHLYQHKAAALLGCNQGRISEAVNGKVHPDAPTANLLNVEVH